MTAATHPHPTRGITPGLPTNAGSFKAAERAEASLNSPLLPPEVEKDKQVRDAVEGMVARETRDGQMTMIERQEDVEEAVRALLPHLDQTAFDARMSQVATLAEQISVVECAEASDTESYQEIADAYGLSLSDAEFEVSCPEPDEPSYDVEAFKAGVIERLDVDLHGAVTALVAADEAASRASAEPVGQAV